MEKTNKNLNEYFYGMEHPSTEIGKKWMYAFETREELEDWLSKTTRRNRPIRKEEINLETAIKTFDLDMVEYAVWHFENTKGPCLFGHFV